MAAPAPKAPKFKQLKLFASRASLGVGASDASLAGARARVRVRATDATAAQQNSPNSAGQASEASHDRRSATGGA